jgi:peptide/nickel transport system substrate-binding protein
MQQQLRALGIDLEIKNYPSNLLFAHDGPIYTGRFDSEFTIDTNGPDPDNEGIWSGKFIPPAGANTSWLNDPIVTRASHDALLTYDRARRRALYGEEEARIHQLVPAVFFYWQNSYAAYNGDLHGWRPATYLSDFWNAWDWRI